MRGRALSAAPVGLIPVVKNIVIEVPDWVARLTKRSGSLVARCVEVAERNLRRREREPEIVQEVGG